MSISKQEILNRAKDRYIREEVEDSFKNPDASFVIKMNCNILINW